MASPADWQQGAPNAVVVDMIRRGQFRPQPRPLARKLPFLTKQIYDFLKETRNDHAFFNRTFQYILNTAEPLDWAVQISQYIAKEAKKWLTGTTETLPIWDMNKQRHAGVYGCLVLNQDLYVGSGASYRGLWVRRDNRLNPKARYKDGALEKALWRDGKLMPHRWFMLFVIDEPITTVVQGTRFRFLSKVVEVIMSSFTASYREDEISEEWLNAFCIWETGPRFEGLNGRSAGLEGIHAYTIPALRRFAKLQKMTYKRCRMLAKAGDPYAIKQFAEHRKNNAALARVYMAVMKARRSAGDPAALALHEHQKRQRVKAYQELRRQAKLGDRIAQAKVARDRKSRDDQRRNQIKAALNGDAVALERIERHKAQSRTGAMANYNAVKAGVEAGDPAAIVQRAERNQYANKQYYRSTDKRNKAAAEGNQVAQKKIAEICRKNADRSANRRKEKKKREAAILNGGDADAIAALHKQKEEEKKQAKKWRETFKAKHAKA